MDDIYREEIIDHYKNPRNFGRLEGANLTEHKANASCGDIMEMSLRFKAGKVEAVKFMGEGCALSMAASSMLTEKIKGMSLVNLKKLDEKFMQKLVGGKINSGRISCILLPLDVLKKIAEKIEE